MIFTFLWCRPRYVQCLHGLVQAVNHRRETTLSSSPSRGRRCSTAPSSPLGVQPNSLPTDPRRDLELATESLDITTQR